jgi:hypothetical protein
VAAEPDVSAPPTPSLEHAFDVAVQVAVPLAIGDVGTGVRRVVDILGGDVSGPRLSGRIRPGGADFQIIRPSGMAELHAHGLRRSITGPEPDGA